MEQHIRFCTTTDGVRIAYATVGEGPPLVLPAWWVSHLERDWEEPAFRAFFETLAQRHTVIRYDRHGVGLSDRDRTDISLQAELHYLETIIAHLRLKRLALLGISCGGPAAVAYAVKYPRRVSHLILYGAYSSGDAIAKEQVRASMLSLVRASWGIGSKTLADVFMPDADASDARSFAKMQRDSASAEMAAQLLDLTYQLDVRQLVPKVRAPTVVIHRRGDKAIGFRLGRELAASISEARFVPLEGKTHPAWHGDPAPVLHAISEFLGDPIPEASVRGLVTILFTDMEGSTALTERLGDAKAQELRRTHDSIVRDALKAKGGSETKHTGDGIMASFPSASRAIESAVAVQRAIVELGDTPLRVRIGLNAGEPVAEEDDLFGTAVNLAKRICDQAEPGQILVSDVVQQLAAGKGFTFADKGEATLKGFEKPVRLHEVVWD
jgi:class 3 adenylate cyclase